MDVLIKAKDGFIHGPYNLHRGQEAVMDKALAEELSHLVEVQGEAPDSKSKAPPENKMMQTPENKGNAPAGGEAQQSSASPAAQVSAKTTAKASGAGAKVGKTAK